MIIIITSVTIIILRPIIDVILSGREINIRESINGQFHQTGFLSTIPTVALCHHHYRYYYQFYGHYPHHHTFFHLLSQPFGAAPGAHISTNWKELIVVQFGIALILSTFFDNFFCFFFFKDFYLIKVFVDFLQITVSIFWPIEIWEWIALWHFDFQINKLHFVIMCERSSRKLWSPERGWKNP